MAGSGGLPMKSMIFQVSGAQPNLVASSLRCLDGLVIFPIQVLDALAGRSLEIQLCTIGTSI